MRFVATNKTILVWTVVLLSQLAVFSGHAESSQELLDRGLEGFRLSLHPSQPQGQAVLLHGDASSRVEVKTLPQHPYQIELKSKLSEVIQAGDVCLLTLRLRTVQDEEHGGAAQSGLMLAKVQKAGPDWDPLFFQRLPINPKWMTFHLPFRADKTLGDVGAELTLHLGYQEQVIEIAEVSLKNFGPDHPLASLPITSLEYEGRSAQAPWRDEAMTRIEQIRRSRLALQVVNQQGEPIEGAMVHVELQRHAFDWGTAVAARRLVDPSPDGDRYREMITQMFNTVTIENALKWDLGENRFFAEHRDEAMQWIHANQLKLRGHCVIWPGWKFMPKRLRALERDPIALSQALDRRIHQAMSNYPGIVEWDFVNEVHLYRDALDVIGDSAMAQWFRLAQQIHPDAILVYNDFGALNFRGQTEKIALIAESLVDQEAPIGAIGLQGHFQSPPTGIPTIQDRLDRLAQVGLPMRITEFDLDSVDAEMQGDFTRDMMILAYSYPSMEGFTVWGFWEPQHWKPRAAMFRHDWTAKPAAKQWRRLVLETWHTHEVLRADADGRVSLPAYHGTYLVKLQHVGQVHEFLLGHDPESGPHVLRLSEANRQ